MFENQKIEDFLKTSVGGDDYVRWTRDVSLRLFVQKWVDDLGEDKVLEVLGACKPTYRDPFVPFWVVFREAIGSCQES